MLAGVLLGAVFFGGFWWTVRRALPSRQAPLWFSGSLLLRTAIVLVGFYLVSHGDWRRMVACVAGFLAARTVVVRYRPHAADRRDIVDLTSDQQILWQHGFVKLNGTIVTTWAMMIAMAIGSKLVTRKLATEGAISRWQGLLEIVVTSIEKQIEEVGLKEPGRYIAFLGTLFLFVAVSALCTVIPGFQPPTGSLSTTAALALCVFVAVPLFGIGSRASAAT